MEIELPIFDSKTRSRLQPKVRKYRIEFDTLKRKFSQLQDNYLQYKNQNKLMGNQSYDRLPENDHVDRIMKQNAALEGAIRTGHETGDIAIDIERNLGDQNIRAKASREKVKRIQGELGESDSILSRMLRREKFNRLIISGICVLLLMVVVIILYFKLIK